jgi:hypothetical protein
MTPYQVNVAAEAFAAVVMSQAGYDVAMQYGTHQPAWDIIATKEKRTLYLQVKGSQDAGWGLFQKYIRNADYHGALDDWLKNQMPVIVYFLVQFVDAKKVGDAPRCYIVRPDEIVAHMRTTRGGHVYTSLRENYSYKRGLGAGHTDVIPVSWLASQTRIDEI